MDMYVLKGKEAVRCDDWILWGAAFDSPNRIVARDKAGEVEVSTVFLGLDHGFGDEVLLFETIVFGGEKDGDVRRYATWNEAKKGHAEALATELESIE